MITEKQFLKDLKDFLSTVNEIQMDTDLLDIEEWDSLSAVSLLVMIEEKYNIKVEPFAIAEAISVEDLYNIIAKN